MQFAVCINNEGYPSSLEVGKLYRILPDDEATVKAKRRMSVAFAGRPRSLC